MPPHAPAPAKDVWSPLDFDHEAFRAGASEQSFRRFARQGVRTLHAAEGGSGTSDTVRLGDDVLLTVINCVLARTARWYRRWHEQGAVDSAADLQAYVADARAAGLAWAGSPSRAPVAA